jgi:hypothetical protein
VKVACVCELGGGPNGNGAMYTWPLGAMHCIQLGCSDRATPRASPAIIELSLSSPIASLLPVSLRPVSLLPVSLLPVSLRHRFGGPVGA